MPKLHTIFANISSLIFQNSLQPTTSFHAIDFILIIFFVFLFLFLTLSFLFRVVSRLFCFIFKQPPLFNISYSFTLLFSFKRCLHFFFYSFSFLFTLQPRSNLLDITLNSACHFPISQNISQNKSKNPTFTLTLLLFKAEAVGLLLQNKYFQRAFKVVNNLINIRNRI